MDMPPLVQAVTDPPANDLEAPLSMSEFAKLEAYMDQLRKVGVRSSSVCSRTEALLKGIR